MDWISTVLDFVVDVDVEFLWWENFAFCIKIETNRENIIYSEEEVQIPFPIEKLLIVVSCEVFCV